MSAEWRVYLGACKAQSASVTLQACTRTGFAAVDARGCAGLKPEVALLAFANAFEAREAVIRRKRPVSSLSVLPALHVVPRPARRAHRQKAQAKAA